MRGSERSGQTGWYHGSEALSSLMGRGRFDCVLHLGHVCQQGPAANHKAGGCMLEELDRLEREAQEALEEVANEN
ncbi:MAG TPA: hypothetical protein VLY63_31385, partial [Anaerolineae bacterium]|nr:hypothetical protein [Anaerolineae bacterium]